MTSTTTTTTEDMKRLLEKITDLALDIEILKLDDEEEGEDDDAIEEAIEDCVNEKDKLIRDNMKNFDKYFALEKKHKDDSEYFRTIQEDFEDRSKGKGILTPKN